MSDGAPLLTPPTITVGRQQAVVVEFNRDFPKNVLVTLDFYDETLSKKIGMVPTNPLGPRTVKAHFPEFAQPGVVHVGVQLARLDSPLFPKFRIRVRNPLESILDVVPHTHANAPSSTALLAAVVAYLGHCDDKELEELDMKMDGTLVNILRSALPHVADWKLSYFLSGKYSTEDNLLHLCLRHKLSGAAMELLASKQLMLQYLHQKSGAAATAEAGGDGKTPLEMAKRNNMKKVAQTLERLQAELKRAAIKSGVCHTPDIKKRKKQALLKRAKSIEQDLSVVAASGATEYGPLPLYPPTNKKKGGRFGKLKRKIQISAPQQPQMDDDVFTTSVEAQPQHTPGELPSSLPAASRLSTRINSSSEAANTSTTAACSTYATTGPEQQPSSKQTLGFTVGDSKRDVALPLPPRGTLSPTDFASADLSTSPTSKTRLGSLMDGSSEGSTHSLEQKKSRPPSSISSGYDSAVSGAIEELKSKRLYVAVLIRDYNWATSPNGNFIVKEGEMVYVTREEPEVVLGVCSKHYGKFPRQVLRRLPSHEAALLEDYECLDGLDDDDDHGTYKYHPRNIPRVVNSGSDSGDQVEGEEEEQQRSKLVEVLQNEGYYMRVPKSSRTMEEYLSSVRQETELSHDELQEMLAAAQVDKQLTDKLKVPPPRVLTRPKPPTRSASMDAMASAAVAAAPANTKKATHSTTTTSSKPSTREKSFEVISKPKSISDSGADPRDAYDQVVMKPRPLLKKQITSKEPPPKVPSHGPKQILPREKVANGNATMKTQGECSKKDSDTLKASQQRDVASSTPPQTSLRAIKEQLRTAGLKPESTDSSDDDDDPVYDDLASVLTGTTAVSQAISYEEENEPSADEIEEIYDNFVRLPDINATASEAVTIDSKDTSTSHPQYINFQILESPPSTQEDNRSTAAQALSKPNNSSKPEKATQNELSTIPEGGGSVAASKTQASQSSVQQASPEASRKKISAPPSPPKRQTPFNPEILLQNNVAIATAQSTAINMKLPSTQSMLERATALAERAGSDLSKNKPQVGTKPAASANRSHAFEQQQQQQQRPTDAHPHSPVPTPRKRRAPNAPSIRTQSVDTGTETYLSQTFPRKSSSSSTSQKDTQSTTTVTSPSNGAKNRAPPAMTPSSAENNETDTAPGLPACSYVNLDILPDPNWSPRIPSRNRSQTLMAPKSPQNHHHLSKLAPGPPVAPRPSSGKRPGTRHASTS